MGFLWRSAYSDWLFLFQDLHTINSKNNIAGDFNFDPLPPLAAALLAVSGWVDLAEHLGPTTAPGGDKTGRRIDRVYANPRQRPLSGKFFVPMASVAFVTHFISI